MLKTKPCRRVRGQYLTLVLATLALVTVHSPATAGSENRPAELNAAARRVHQFDIAEQRLDSALREFAGQSRLQLLYSAELTEGLWTRGISGRHSAWQALEELIPDQDLAYEFHGRRDVVLTRSERSSSGFAAGTNADAQEPTAAAGQDQGPEGQDEEGQETEAAAADFGESITVTGSNIPVIDEETALPVSKLETEDILLREPATTTELLETLPQAQALENQEGSTGPNDARGDASSVNLRGLGSGSTLVLLNGRRLPPHPISSGAVPRLTVNVNTIPTGALKRVEVLRDGASAVYGTDAAAGVINAIVRNQVDGRFDLTGRFGGTDQGSLREGSLSLAAGLNPKSGQTRFFLYGDGLDRDGLRGRDKDFANSTDLRERSGSTSTRWDNSSVNTPNGRYRTGTANADGSFSSRRVNGGPDDDFYIGNDGGLVYGGLPRSLRFNFAADRFLVPDTRRFNLYGKVDHQVRDNLSFFGDAMFYRADSTTASAAVAISGSSNNNIFVPRENYHNPFGTRFFGPGTANPDVAAADVLIRNYRPVELGERFADVESTAYRLLGGFRGFFADAWTWESALTWGTAESTDFGRNMLSESRLREALARSTPDAWNVFGRNSQEVLDTARISTRRDGSTTLGILDGKLTGILAQAPAGPIYLATGLEFRTEDFEDRRDALSNADDVIAQSQTSNSDGDRDIASGFAEISLPLLDGKPGAYHLNITLAARYEHFSDFGDTTKPKVSLSWYPVRSVLARASYTEGFRAPNLAQLFTGEIVRRTEGVQDPYRAEVTATSADLGDVSRQIVRGGNPNLTPEESETMTAGIVIAPPASRFFISLDYWQIDQTDRIATFGHQDQLDLDFLLRSTGQGFNSAVVRGAPTAADVAAFGAFNAANGTNFEAAGEIQLVRDTFINLSSREVTGWDVGLSYRTKDTAAGLFRFKSELTYYDSFDEQRDSDSPALSRLRLNGNPRFRGNASISWSRKQLGAGLLGKVISDFDDTSAPAADGGIFIVDEWLTFNTYLSYALDRGAAKGLSLRLSVRNVLDEEPPLADEIRGFFNQYHSPRGRSFYLTLRKGF
ncbi:MAG: TonB-dependent receptor [Deltaproteobacteria bacterium]|nr:TonB-dependent receptor [Deltaproteobacteria bacterium]